MSLFFDEALEFFMSLTLVEADAELQLPSQAHVINIPSIHYPVPSLVNSESRNNYKTG
jgi:hypothetical protein